MISVSTRRVAPGSGQVNLVVAEANGVITVTGGVFTINKVARTLIGDWTYTLTSEAEARSLRGYIVEDGTSGDIELYVDDILASEDSADWAAVDKIPLYALFIVSSVPANETTFDNATDIEVFKSLHEVAA